MQEVWLRPGHRTYARLSRLRWVGLGKLDLQSLHCVISFLLLFNVPTICRSFTFVSIGKLIDRQDIPWLLSSSILTTVTLISKTTALLLRKL